MTDKNNCTSIKNNRIVAVEVRQNKWFSMKIKTKFSQEVEYANILVKTLTLQQWHNILGHQNVH